MVSQTASKPVRRQNSNRCDSFAPGMHLLLLLSLTIIFSAPHAYGFIAPAVSSSRAIPALVTPCLSSKKKHRSAKFASSIENETTQGDKKPTRNPLKKAYRIYTGYATQLWKETEPSERTKIANDKIAKTVRDMQHVLTSEHETISMLSSSSSSNGCGEASKQLLESCENMLSVLEETKEMKKQSKKSAGSSSTEVATTTSHGNSEAPKKEKKQRSILFGALMGAAVACWVFSGNYIFTGLFCLVTILGQLEYYRMVMQTGVFPARRISVVGATSMFLTVCIIVFRTY